MKAAGKEKFVVVGAGLGGALMAVYLGKAGYEVEVYERRLDPRGRKAERGRSINLAISTRGIHALGKVGLAREILDMAVPMRGRMIHSPKGELSFQPYGTREDQVINSVERAGLNLALVKAAESFPNIRFVFGKRCAAVDLEGATVELEDTGTGERSSARGDVLVGADGAYSTLRREMQKLERFDYEQSYLGHGYKELGIPPGPNGGFRMEPNALHIWPRGGFMMIALPNRDGSFTCTCFWPYEGPNGFEALRTEQDVMRYFGETFPDALPLMPTLATDYFENPTGSLVTIRCYPWHHEHRAVLLGDACHAVVPFYGQGANAAFEDCSVLDECIGRHPGDLQTAFSQFGCLRKEHADALADLALANFVEMRDYTASRLFLLRKRLEGGLHRLFPRWFVPLYAMVTFSTIPYAEAVRKARRQDRTVRALAGGGGLVLVLVLAVILLWALARR